jgi:tRNA-2-methylthio-N6-dimethylallyladenosine synthase
VDEVRRLADQGVKEVTLLGQNVTAYGLAEARRQTTHCRGDSPFADLLETLHPIEGIRRIRFTSPHPRDMNERFIATVTTLPKVCNAFHVPLQSGSDRILELMHRGYTVGQYLDVIDGLRRAGPDTTLSTDVIVGFPSETEDEFLQTKAVMERVRYDMAYVFKYSPREGTRAARDLEDDVDKDEKLRRNHVLLETLEAGVATANERYVGMDVEVLVEGASPRNPETWCGRTRNSKVCIFPPVPGLHPGDLVTVRIDRVTSHSLFGTAAGAPAS